jgi:polyisoprenoid-binding protein YceI
MKSLAAAVLLAVLISFQGYSQKFGTRNGHIRFLSESPIENIEANNRQVNSTLDLSTGDFTFRVLMKAFDFEKEFMQEQFNKNYVESDKYPEAIFTGKIMNVRDIGFPKEGIYSVIVEGKLSMHGISKALAAKGTIEVKEGKLLANSKFNILLTDFNISIPASVASNISRTIVITVDGVLVQ